MSKKANPTFIGLFIVIGVALGVTGLLLFSSSKLFSPTRAFVLYFDQSLNGLSEGAPVKYRGVTIGSVTRVMVHSNQLTNDYAMPVIVELDYKLLRERLGDQSSEFFTGNFPGAAHPERPPGFPGVGEPGDRRPLHQHPFPSERTPRRFSISWKSAIPKSPPSRPRSIN